MNSHRKKNKDFRKKKTRFMPGRVYTENILEDFDVDGKLSEFDVTLELHFDKIDTNVNFDTCSSTSKCSKNLLCLL